MPDTGEDRTWAQKLLSPIAEVRRDEAAGVAAHDAADVPRSSRVLHAQDGARSVHPQRGRRGGEELLLGRPGTAAAVPGAGVRGVRLARQPRAPRARASRCSSSPASCCSFLAALGAGLQVGIVYFLWVGIFNVMVIAQFWAFANDVYTVEQGKRLFPVDRGRRPAWAPGSARCGPAPSSASRVRPGCSSAAESSSSCASCDRRDRSGRERARRRSRGGRAEKPLGKRGRVRADPQGPLPRCSSQSSRCC